MTNKLVLKKIKFIIFSINLILITISCDLPNELPVAENLIINPSKIKESSLPNYMPVNSPSNVKATKGLKDRIDLSWNHFFKAVSYNIYRSTSENGSYQLISKNYFKDPSEVTKKIYFSDDGTKIPLKSSVNFYYRVTAVDEKEIESGFSKAEKGFCYLSTSTLEPPLLIYGSDGDFEDKIEVKWNIVYNAEAYIIYRSESEDGPFDKTTRLPIELSKRKNTYAINTNASLYETKILDNFYIFIDKDLEHLPKNKKFYYAVQTVKEGGEEKSPLSEVVKGSRADNTITANIPSLRASEGTRQHKIIIEWDNIDEMTKYGIFRSNEEDGIYSEIAIYTTTENAPRFIDDSAEIVDEKDHYYRIQCYKENQHGALSKQIVKGWVAKENPVITILGENPLIFDLTDSTEFEDPGIIAIDNVDGDITWSATTEATLFDPTVRGEYEITYSVTDQSGRATTATRIVKVVANIDDSQLTINQNLLYPDDESTLCFKAENLTADSRGGEITYRWIIDNDPSISTNTLNLYERVYSVGDHSITVIANNADDEIQKIVNFKVYPPCPKIENGNFEETTDVAPWIWDIDYYWDSPVLGPAGRGWNTSQIGNISGNISVSEEQIVNLEIGKGINGSKAATICDTTPITGGDYFNPWAIDIAETAGCLKYKKINLSGNIPYKFKANVYRGINTSTKITVKITSTSTTPVDLDINAPGENSYISEEVPSEKEIWHTVEFEFTPENDTEILIEFFKGNDWKDSDTGEVRFDNISLEYTH